MSNCTIDATTIDFITEMMNIGVGRAASSLSELIGCRIELTVPTIRICSTEKCRSSLFLGEDQPETMITQTFDGVVHGRMSLCFPEQSSLALAQILSGGSMGHQDQLDVESSGILLEVGNIVLNGVMGSLSNAMKTNLVYSIPELQTASRTGVLVFQNSFRDDDILIGDVHFSVAERQIEGTIVIVFAVGSIRVMMDSVLQPESV